MKKIIISTMVIAASFALGFAFNNLISEKPAKPKVTGIGGIFFKCKDPKKLKEWYKTHLGLNTNAYGATFEWRQDADSTKKCSTQWSAFSEKTTYFQPSEKDYMINYVVNDLPTLIQKLKTENVTIVDTMESYDYGSFIHIMDIEGNKIELWEPK